MVDTQYWNLPPQASADRWIIIFCHARMVVDKFVVPQDHKLSAWYKRWIGPSDPRTIGLFFWTIFFGLFLDHSVWTFYWTNFWTIFSTILSEGRQTIGMQSISTQEGVGGKLLFIQIIRAVFRQTFFYVKLFALDRSVSLYFWHANAKLAPKHWTMIVIAIKTLLV